MLPDSDPMAQDFKFIINKLPATETLYIDIQNLTGDKKLFQQAADEFYAQISPSDFFSEIVYRFFSDDFLNLVKLVRKNRSTLLNENDLAIFESRLTKEEIHAHLIAVKRQFLNPSGIFMGDALIHDPLKVDELVLSKLDTFKNEAYGMKIEGSRIYSKDSDHILMMAMPSFSAVDTQKSLEMMTFLNELRDRLTDKYHHKIKIRLSGNHVATLDNSQTIQQDVKRTIFVLSIGILLIGILFFRRKTHIILIFLPTMISLSFASAFVSFIYKDISAIALGCGAVLIGITVDFGIHILFGVDAGHGSSPETIIQKLRRPIFAGAFTTMAAFSCLIFSSLAGQRQMGVFSIIGIFGAAFFAVFLLRYFIPAHRENQRQPLINLVAMCDRLMEFRKKHINLICLAGAALTIVGLLGINAFEFEGDVSKLNHLQPATQSDMNSFLETWGGFSPSLILVKADTLDRALEKNDALNDLLTKIQKKGMIEQITTLSDIFPSSKKREENNRHFKTLINEKKILQIEQMFENAARLEGFKQNTFQPFIDTLKQGEADFSIKDFDNTVLKKLIDSKIIFQDNEVFILTTIQIKDKTLIPGIIEQIKSNIPGTMFLDKKYFISTITSIVAKEFKKLFFFAGAAMILVLTVFFRNLKIVSIIVTPVFSAAFITAGILGLFNIPINLISIIFIIFVFGVGVDFSIFLANHELYKEKNEPNVTAGAVIVCALTTIGAFVCLVFAQHEALFSIGVAGLTGMVTSLILSLMLIPSLIQKFIRLKDQRRFNG
ncbi:MAG: MMPL family transporter [Thermodesulfobacteriota bacterium]